MLCSCLPNGSQEGFVLGSYYTGSNMPDGDGTGVYRTAYADGTVIEYNLGSNTASIKSNFYVSVEAKDVTVKAEETVSVTAKAAEVTAETATVTADSVKIVGNVQIVGNVSVTGSIAATGDIMASGKSDNHHAH